MRWKMRWKESSVMKEFLRFVAAGSTGVRAYGALGCSVLGDAAFNKCRWICTRCRE